MKKIMNKFKREEKVIASIEADVAKFHDGDNGAAGAGVRGCYTTGNLQHNTFWLPFINFNA